MLEWSLSNFWRRAVISKHRVKEKQFHYRSGEEAPRGDIIEYIKIAHHGTISQKQFISQD